MVVHSSSLRVFSAAVVVVVVVVVVATVVAVEMIIVATMMNGHGPIWPTPSMRWISFPVSFPSDYITPEMAVTPHRAVGWIL